MVTFGNDLNCIRLMLTALIFTIGRYFVNAEMTRGIQQCAAKQFQCNNGHCVPLMWVCEGDDDCGDGSDESPALCNGNNTCPETHFRCGSGNCIPKKWQCDNDNDCSDKSDEDPKICQTTRSPSCRETEFACSSGECIPPLWVCDSHPDCLDKSDELICKKRICGADEFTCRSRSGECVPLTWMCDDTPDCADASDEKACNETCRTDEFTCDNGKCIQQRWKCDRDNDCGDSSDERDCPETTCDPKEQFMCADGSCISLRWRCDGDIDCLSDDSDEKNCSSSTPLINRCLTQEFQCRDRMMCVHRTWVCDGDKDCADASDESPELCRNVTCRPDQFACNDRECIAGHLQCNGQAECSDGSDEFECDGVVRKCDKTREFECGGGMCVPLSKVCNKRPDCPNGEDEPKSGCDVDECSVNNGNCSHICVDLPLSYRCDCRPGYRLVDGRTCVDIDECAIPGSCSQLCTNEKGSFKCECVAGYMRDPNDHSKCKATEGHASILFARKHDIRKISVDHNEMSVIVNNTKSASALDFVFRTGMIFWSDIAERKIYKAPIDEGDDRTVVISDDVTSADGLAVDWIYNHIYWADSKKNTIELSNFEGNMRKTLIKDSLGEPRALAVNPLRGWIFWTDWGSIPRIERAGMDGTHRKTIVTYDVKWPNGLTLDLVQERIYWVDAKLNIISSCDYHGENRRLVLHSSVVLKHPFSISTFEDWIYWTDWDRHTIYKANKFTGKSFQNIIPLHMLQNPMVIHVYHPYRQPDGINHCAAVNGHCSHLCLPAPQINKNSPKISCACPDGLTLMSDRLMCAEDESRRVEEPTDESYNTQVEKNDTHITSSILNDGNSDFLAAIVIGFASAIIIVLSLISFIFYRQYLHRNIGRMNFDNPVYRKTTEDQFSLEKSQYQPAKIFPPALIEETQEPLTGNNEYV